MKSKRAHKMHHSVQRQTLSSPFHTFTLRMQWNERIFYQNKTLSSTVSPSLSLSLWFAEIDECEISFLGPAKGEGREKTPKNFFYPLKVENNVEICSSFAGFCVRKSMNGPVNNLFSFIFSLSFLFDLSFANATHNPGPGRLQRPKFLWVMEIFFFFFCFFVKDLKYLWE